VLWLSAATGRTYCICVLGLLQVQYDDFEIVVVADAKGLAALDAFKGKVKTVQFDDANFSMARNIGIVHSAGEIVAFIDDGVPEPTLLTYLVSPFLGMNSVLSVW
jgi:glycosyltransferase involved in cell wall biosynthesis